MLQHCCGILGGRIDIDVRAQVFRQLFLVTSTPDCDSTKSHMPGKLDAKMPKSTNALHGDKISAAQAGVAKSVVSRDTCAKQGGGFGGLELIWNRADAARFSDHYFRIPSIRRYSRYHRVLTIHDVSTPARFAHPVFSCNEADSNPLSDFPSRHSTAQGFHTADDFMSRNTWQSQAWVSASDRGRVGVTDSTCFHSNPNLARPGFRNCSFDNVKAVRCRDFDRPIRFCHLTFHFLHLERCLVFHRDEITVSPCAPNPTASLDWLDPDRSPASCCKALVPSSSSRRRVRNRGCIDESLQLFSDCRLCQLSCAPRSRRAVSASQ